ncbi:MAG: antibiotic biosynthesis monooxygenase [Mycolicibacterium sp.]|nr:antibiotic biosynthesis monooxygenase [Mycolicibacterium sp.]
MFHPVADESAFDGWLSRLRASARSAAGFASSATSIRDDDLDWAMAVTFTDEDLLHRWLDGDERRAIMKAGQSQGFWSRTSDLILGQGVADPPGVGAFRHDVVAGKETDFRAIQDRLARASSAFPGYEGTVLLPPDEGTEWLSMLRFRTPEQLSDWLRSPQRDQALPGLRSSLSKGFSAVSSTTPFATTVRVQDGRTLMTPSWKSAMLVLLVLYPTVMVLSRFFGPLLDQVGAEPWLALWISQIVSVSALQWWLMPAITRPFRKWLDPVDGAGVRMGLIGASVVFVGYAVTLGIFATVTWLQFWDHRR